MLEIKHFTLMGSTNSIVNDHVVLLGHMTNYKHISTTIIPMVIKLGRVVSSYNEKLLLIDLHNPSVTWFYELK